jgi:hypothetical protein
MEIIREMPTYSVAFCDDVVLFVPAGPPRKEEIEGLTQSVTQLRKRSQKPIALFLFVPVDAASPAGSDYQTAKQGFLSLVPDLAVSAWVMEGSGFVAAAKRALTAFLTSSMLGKVPTKVFSTPREAASWMVKQPAAAELRIPSLDSIVESVSGLNGRMLFRQGASKDA